MEAGEQPRWRPHRLVALADGVFAIALTLLALEVRLPSGIETRVQFRHAVPGFLLQLAVYALGFFIIAQVWQRHHRVMHFVEWVDLRDIRRTILVLAAVASLPIAIDLVTHEAQFPEAVAIAAAMLTLTSLLMLWLEAALLRPGLATVEPGRRSLLLIRGAYSALVFGSAIPLAYLLPNSGRAPLVWWAMLLVGPVSTGVDRLWQRMRRRLHPSAAARRSRGATSSRPSRPARRAVRRGP